MSNTFTDDLQDGQILTEGNLETALTSLQLSLTNTPLLTQGATANSFLQAPTPGNAATWTSIPNFADSKDINKMRNYGLSAVATSGTLVISLKGANGNNPASNNQVVFDFPQNNSVTSGIDEVTVTSAVSITINSSASLGTTSTDSTRVYVYAIKPSSSVRLAVSRRSDFEGFGEPDITLMSSSADARFSLYGTAANSAVPCKLLGFVEAARNSSIQWQTPSKVMLSAKADYASDESSASVDRMLQNATRETGTSVEKGGVAISNSCGSFSTTSGTRVDVTNLSVSIETSGRPVMLMLQSESGLTSAYFGAEATANTNPTEAEASFSFVRGTSTIAVNTLDIYVDKDVNTDFNLFKLRVPPAALSFVDTPSAGTHTYKVQANYTGFTDGLTRVKECRLVAYEL